VLDRVTFARGLAEGFGLDPSLISGKPTAELAQGAPRPLSGGLLSPRLDVALPGALRPLAEAMADFKTCVTSIAGMADPLRQASA
jgi:dTDP-4-dehydrorhamnose reductase